MKRSAASTAPVTVRATLLTGDAIGGQNFWATTAEVRFPLPFIPEDLGISGAAFADAGSLWGVPGDVDSISIAEQWPSTLLDDSSVRAAVGVSLLWNSPVGPLRVDYAEPIAKEAYDQRSRICALVLRPSSDFSQSAV